MRGGKRQGAGRKPGTKSRLPGALARAVESKLSDVLKDRKTPLEFLLSVMSNKMVRGDKVTLDHRLEAARAAAPYLHRKQPQDVTVGGSLQLPVSITMQVVGPRRG